MEEGIFHKSVPIILLRSLLNYIRYLRYGGEVLEIKDPISK